MTVDALKRQIRAEQKRLRTAMKPKEKRKADRAIVRQALGSVPIRKTDIIAGYWPLPAEPDIRLLLEIFAEQGRICALPVIEHEKEPLTFRRYRPGDALSEHPSLKIQEPLDTAPAVLPTVLLVPLLAFDAEGNRLGFGGGYYDRTIAFLRDAYETLAVGIGYAFQQIPVVPHARHDERLDCIVTEKGVILCDGG